MKSEKGLVIWILSDKRRGHLNQSIALADALSEFSETECHLIEVGGFLNNFLSLLTSTFSDGDNLPQPHLIIATGHKTHFATLAAKRRYGGRTIIIMRPSLPADFFDLIILPNHDKPLKTQNKLIIEGALSRISPDQEGKNAQCIIILGGPSKHYHFDEQDVFSSIQKIYQNSDSSKIIITDSPRTPLRLTRKMMHHFEDIFISWDNFKEGAIQEEMKKSAEIWVTEDSISMIYDALSTGSCVGIIPASRKGDNRLSKTVDSIIERKFATSFKQWSTDGVLNPSPMLCEAKRCASFVMKTFFFKKFNSS